MPLYKCLLTNNPCFKSAGTIVPKGVMVHSTGANNPTIKRYVQPLNVDVPGAYEPDRQTLLNLIGVNKNANDWNHTTREVGVHAFIGKLADGSVAAVQTLPWNHRGWHAASGSKGSANNTHIAFEICEDDLTDHNYFIQAKNQAVELTAYLCQMYNLDPMADGVVICHQDGYKRGIANNHGDIYNWWPKHNYTMDDFRAEVLAAMETPKEEEKAMKYYRTIYDVPSYYRPSVEKAMINGGLFGTGDGEINVSEDLCRILTVLDRLKKLE